MALFCLESGIIIVIVHEGLYYLVVRYLSFSLILSLDTLAYLQACDLRDRALSKEPVD